MVLFNCKICNYFLATYLYVYVCVCVCVCVWAGGGGERWGGA